MTSKPKLDIDAGFERVAKRFPNIMARLRESEIADAQGIEAGTGETRSGSTAKPRKPDPESLVIAENTAEPPA